MTKIIGPFLDPFLVQKFVIFARKSGFLEIVHQNFMWLGQRLKMFALNHLTLLLGLGKLKFRLIWPFVVQNTLHVVTGLGFQTLFSYLLILFVDGSDWLWLPPRDLSIARLFLIKIFLLNNLVTNIMRHINKNNNKFNIRTIHM